MWLTSILHDIIFQQNLIGSGHYIIATSGSGTWSALTPNGCTPTHELDAGAY